ncbi:MAG: serine/threonine protein kinase [Oscillospiraceae bacterium]|jgi:serine/threonine protein kinase|nr:serine/threonine protein kinase [Oscillospiraceae bacterium]
MAFCNSCFLEYDDTLGVCPHCGFEPGAPVKEVFYLYPGTLLAGRYTIGKVLGFGGFGITYKAFDRTLQTVVAVKEYYPSGIVNRVPGMKEVRLYASNKTAEFKHGLERFIDEAKAMAKFGTHKNIVNVYDHFEENSSAYIVMEFLDGINLSEFLKMNTMSPDTGIDLILNVCSGLKDIHAQGIIHRDISPDNIFICINGSIKLIDFGAARFAANEEEKLLTIILKPGYAPPEQYEKVNMQGPWTDVYALGATLYYAITGVKPEESTNRRIEDTLVPPRELNPEISENLSNTILKAMAIDRHMRFKNVAEFEIPLKEKKKIVPLKIEKQRRQVRRVVGVAAAALVVAVGVYIFGVNFNKELEAETLPDAQVSFLYELSGDEAMNSAKESAYKSVIGIFNEKFENVTVELKGVPAFSYESEVSNAISAKKAIVLFESDNLSSTVLDKSKDLSAVITSELKSECYFLSGYKGKKQLPLGFIAPVVYVNTTLLETDAHGIANTDTASAEQEAFLTGEAPMYLSDSSEFFRVRAELPAQYALMYIDTKNVEAEYSYFLSATYGNDDGQKVIERFLTFCYSANAQDYLFVRSQSDSLPINKSVLDVFTTVYNDFEGFFDNISKYTVNS